MISRSRAVMLQRGQQAAEALEAQVKARLNTPYPPASRPGEPPHKRIGALQRSIKAVARLLNYRIRVQLTASAERKGFPYPLALQRGTRKMAARPFAGLPPDARLVVDFLSGRRKS